MQSFAAACVRTFHTYAGWLAGISWRLFALLSILLLILAAILQELPPFRIAYTETVSGAPVAVVVPRPPKAPAAPAPTTQPTTRPVPPAEAASAASSADKGTLFKLKKFGRLGEKGVEISIDDKGVHITPRALPPGVAASAAGAEGGVEVKIAPGLGTEAIRQAVEEARRELQQAVEDARRDAADAVREQAEAARDAAQTQRDAADAQREAAQELAHIGPRERTRVVRMGEHLPGFAMLWILASAIVKVTYKKQIQAEAQAQQAVETAEAESLKRQVVEARMAAMQAQVEPHFLFNTLASIDHLIEVDPKRASAMQKNLIALLRASMPTMREANDGGVRNLGRELAVIRPYLEILKVRMEERLATSVDVPDGLLSAEFPPMMLQTLVENAIKHGLEPKPEGGTLRVKAEILHGKLAMSVADTGLGFGRAATAGTGVGLANIRERLQLLYGPKASLTIAENPGGGTLATITVPYKPIEGAGAA